MKVTREKDEFNPITITIETKEEADFMWHLLNVGNPFEKYSRKHEISNCGTRIFGEYDSVYSVSEG